jgi:competence protein ComEA
MPRNQDRTRQSVGSDDVRVIVLGSSLLMWIAVAFTSLTAASSAAQPSAAAFSQSQAGPGNDTLVRVCSDCHGLDVIEGQRRTRAQWREVVEDMVSRGANASEDDTKTIIEYLASALGRVNVNRAAESDIQTVLELSPAEASAIVNYRTNSGQFKNVDDLRKVPGLDFSKVDPKKDRIAFADR